MIAPPRIVLHTDYPLSTDVLLAPGHRLTRLREVLNDGVIQIKYTILLELQLPNNLSWHHKESSV